MESTVKRDKIIEIEHQVQSSWNTMVRADDRKKKMFVTFPIPYQNGLLHLGHAFTISKAIFIAAYYRLRGYNVLFPFGYHGTGAPIYSSSVKLKHELETYKPEQWSSLPDNSQIKILLNMGIPESEIVKFVDPYYWIIYFPKIAEKDVINFGAKADFSRSFVTTNLNIHFDSFVRWQFIKLLEKGLVIYGKRYVIFSEKDGQPCADHDRSGGCEGIEPKRYTTQIIPYILKNGTSVNLIAFCKIHDDKKPKIYTNKISFDPSAKYVMFSHGDQKYIVREFAFKNISKQYENISREDYVDNSEFNEMEHNNYSKVTGFIIDSEYDPTRDFTYYEPENIVISRSGDTCVVALTSQWFINYGDESLKQQVNEYINTKIYCPDPAVKNNLLKSSKWISEWPCSRNYGLGTFLPGTNQLIDSLSDSTIYMAFYTVAHLIKEIPAELVDFVWDYIFGFRDTIPENLEQYECIVKEMRKEFEYWYPVDIRVSGKDLVANHLTMSLYNHMAIWGEKYCPRSYAINGYQMLNGKKMSKSEGNFMTLRDAIDKYGSDPVRMSLCECDGIDDSDFREVIANANVLKIHDERELFQNIVNLLSKVDPAVYKTDDTTNYSIIDHIVNNEIRMFMKRASENYKNYKFRSVLYDCYYNAVNERDEYLKIIGTENYSLIYRIASSMLLMICPICPHMVSYVWDYAKKNGVEFPELWDENFGNIDDATYNYYKYFKDELDEITRVVSRKHSSLVELKNKKNIDPNHFVVEITTICDFTDSEKILIEKIRDFYESKSIDWKQFVAKTLSESSEKEKKDTGRFLSWIKKKIESYGNAWYKCIAEPGTEFEILKKWVPVLIRDKYLVKQIEVIQSGQSNKYKYENGPGNPIINFV